MSARWLPVLAFLTPALYAQTCILLSSAVVAPGGTASLEMSLNSHAKVSPAALQWHFQYSPAEVSSFIVDDGPAATAAGKSVICGGAAGASTCLVVGANARTIGNGVVARVTAVLARESSTAVIRVTDAMAATPDGYFLPITAGGGILTSPNTAPDSSLRPRPTRLIGPRCPSQ